MQITTTQIRAPRQPAFTQPKQAASSQEQLPSESVTLSSGDLGMAGMGAAAGTIGIGAPAALAMGSVKSFMSGRPLLGTGLAVAGLAAGATLGTAALMGAAMSSDSGSSVGFSSYLAAGAATTVAAGFAIF